MAGGSFCFQGCEAVDNAPDRLSAGEGPEPSWEDSDPSGWPAAGPYMPLTARVRGFALALPMTAERGMSLLLLKKGLCSVGCQWWWRWWCGVLLQVQSCCCKPCGCSLVTTSAVLLLLQA